MRKLINYSTLVILVALCALACTKSSNNYSATDHTVGLTKLKHWTGTSSGYEKGDTTIAGRDTIWALSFNRIITDTPYAVQKINGFQINVLGTVLNYKATDSITTHTVTFDSTVTGSLTAVLTYYYIQDSATYVLHTSTGYNAAANQYYQVNMNLHTVPN